MYKKAHINITLDDRIIRWIDSIRGQDPRSKFINKVLSKFCSKSQAIFDWATEGQLADEDIKAGRVEKFKDAKKAVKWLKS